MDSPIFRKACITVQLERNLKFRYAVPKIRRIDVNTGKLETEKCKSYFIIYFSFKCSTVNSFATFP